MESIEEQQARKQKRDARSAMDEATARMERLANQVIERIIRQGYVDKADVKALRAGDAACRKAMAEAS